MQPDAMQTDDGLRLMCEWFVMCDKPAEWGAIGVDGMYVPICQRCADKVGFASEDLATYTLDGPWEATV